MPASVVRALWFALACLCLLPVGAEAAASRPNALDYRVDAIPAARLMSEPAQQLVDPDRQVAAQRLVRWMLPGWLGSVLLPVVLLGYFWQSGTAARLRDLLRARLRNESLARLAFGAALGALVQLSAAVPEFYVYRVQRVMGLSQELFRFWTEQWIFSTLFAMLIGAITVCVALWLVDRTHQWYLYTMAFIVVATVGVAAVRPAVSEAINGHAALPAKLATRIESLESRAGLSVPVVIEYTGSQTSLGTVTIEGIGPTQRIVVSENLLAAASPEEFEWAVATQLGRIANADPLHNALYAAAFIIFGAALAVFVSDRIGFRRDDDAVSRLALLTAFLGIVYLVVAPVNNTLLQVQTARADTLAQRWTTAKPAAVRALVRMVDQRMDEVCPSTGARLFLNRMPPPAERIASYNGSSPSCSR